MEQKGINWQNFLKTLGPGILFASTCIGVSHLVQSTRAGADYGFALVWAIILANLFKYPFFEFASRYANATGVSIIDGYYKKSRWILIAFGLLTIFTMFIVTAAVTFVTAGLLSNLMQFDISTDTWVLIITLLCAAILIFGKYSLLDGILKVIGTVLVISTLAAFISALVHGQVPAQADFIPKEVYDNSGIIFLVALMGWMPTAVDMSTWNSLWTEARIKQTGYYPKLKETLLDFNLGYGISAILAIFFLSLGALVIYGSGTELSNSSPIFAHQLISMYTNTIGKWSYLIIALAAFSTMFSTSLAVMDGYGRAMSRIVTLLWGDREKESRKPFIIWVFVLAFGTYLVATQFVNSLTGLVDLATVVSFVIAPLAGYLNYVVIYSKEVKPEFLPPTWLKWLAIAGLAFLILFTFIYFYVRFY